MHEHRRPSRGIFADHLREGWAHVTLRTKITGVTVFILSLGLIVAGFGTQSFLRPQLIAAQDAQLRQVQTDPRVVLGPEVHLGALNCAQVARAIPSFFVAILDSEGAVRCHNMQAADTASMPIVPSLTFETAQQHANTPFSLTGGDGIEWRATVIPVFSTAGGVGGALIIASSTAPANHTMTRFVLVFSGFGAAVLLLGAVLTRILVSTTFMPLAEVEQTALEISRGDFSKRIMVSSPSTEVGHLGQSLNVMLDRIDASFDERQRTIEQMRRFISDAGHELRTPLVSVRGYAEMYRHGWLSDEAALAQAMERIEKEAVRMGSLVEDLLSLARLDERRPLDLKPLKLNELALDAALDATAQAPDREVRVLEDAPCPQVIGDEHRVRQVMTNLIGNALRYTPAGSPIEIRLHGGEREGFASFAVVDHGEGIPEQLHHKIFDRFWRADTSRNRETGGSGLGLSIVRSIVAAHGGQVEVHQTPGGGATFNVQLPTVGSDGKTPPQTA